MKTIDAVISVMANMIKAGKIEEAKGTLEEYGDYRVAREQLEAISGKICDAIETLVDMDPDEDTIEGRYLTALTTAQTEFEKEAYPQEDDDE